jgi:cell wall-associated NlpC family hydrolase
MKTSEILQGDILFCSGKGIIQTLIQWITRSKFYHTAIFIDDGITLAEAQGGEKTSIVPLSKYINSNDKLYIYRDNTLTNFDKYKIANYALNHLGTEYDYLAILAELARYELGVSLKYFNEGNKRICSSFVNECYSSIGKRLSEERVPSPQDLIEGRLKKIGVLKNN